MLRRSDRLATSNVDGGVSRAIFFRLPYVPPPQREAFGVESLYGSTLYAMVAGKLYADPAPVKPLTFNVAGAAIGSLLYSQTRGDLFNLFTLCLVSGMNFKLSAIPQDLLEALDTDHEAQQAHAPRSDD